MNAKKNIAEMSRGWLRETARPRAPTNANENATTEKIKATTRVHSVAENIVPSWGMAE